MKSRHVRGMTLQLTTSKDKKENIWREKRGIREKYNEKGLFFFRRGLVGAAA
jgi:hypothetical protein